MHFSEVKEYFLSILQVPELCTFRACHFPAFPTELLLQSVLQGENQEVLQALEGISLGICSEGTTVDAFIYRQLKEQEIIKLEPDLSL